MVLGISSMVEGKVGSIKGKQGKVIGIVGDGVSTEMKWLIKWREAIVTSANSSVEHIIPLSNINDDKYSDSIITFKETNDEVPYSSYELKELDIVQLVPKKNFNGYSNKFNMNTTTTTTTTTTSSSNSIGDVYSKKQNYDSDSDSDSDNDSDEMKIKRTTNHNSSNKRRRNNEDDNNNVMIDNKRVQDASSIKRPEKVTSNNNSSKTSIYGKIHYQMPLSRTEYYKHCKGTNKRAKRRCCRVGCPEKTAFYCVICSKPDQDKFSCFCSNDICFSEHVIENYIAQFNSTKS